MSKEKETGNETVSFSVSETTILAVSILLASVILTGGLIYSANTISTGFSGLAVLGAKDTGTTTGTNPTPSQGNTEPTPTQEPTADLSKIAKGGLAFGNDNAPVTIVEYSDFQCPFCESFYTATLKSLETDYISTGKVQFIFKNFPLRSIHPNAEKASEAFECAVDQGKGIEMHNALFEKQTEWSGIGVSKIKEIAATVVGDANKFNSCLDNGDKKAVVDEQYNEVVALGGSGTPTFFIGKTGEKGQMVVGAQPYSSFQSVIDGLLG